MQPKTADLIQYRPDVERDFLGNCPELDGVDLPGMIYEVTDEQTATCTLFVVVNFRKGIMQNPATLVMGKPYDAELSPGTWRFADAKRNKK